MAITLDPNIAMSNVSTAYSDPSIAAADRLSTQIEGATTDEDTLQACKDFEAYMLEQIFKKMNESAKLLGDDDEEDDGGSQAYVDMFEDNYYQDIAKRMMSAGQGVGIAEQLYESITNQKLGISKDTTTTEQAAAAAKEAAETAQKTNQDSANETLAKMIGTTAEAVESMTPKQKAEMASLATQSSFASTLSGSGE